MKKQTVLAASEFKAKCLRLLDEVAQKGSTLIITKRGRPLAKVVPLAPPRKSLRGTWTGVVKVKGDIVHFGIDQDWESAR